MQSLLLQNDLSTSLHPAVNGERQITCCLISYLKGYCVHCSVPWHIHPFISYDLSPVCNCSETPEAQNICFFIPTQPPLTHLFLVCFSLISCVSFPLSLSEIRQALRCGKHIDPDRIWLLCKGSSLIFNPPGSSAIIHPEAEWLTFSDIFWCLAVVPLIKSFVQKAKLIGVSRKYIYFLFYFSFTTFY